MEGLFNPQKGPCPLVENHWLRGFINLQTSDLNPQSSNSHHLTARVSDSLLLRADHSGTHHNAISPALWSHSTMYGGWETKQEIEQPHVSWRLWTLPLGGLPLVIWCYIHLLGSPKGQLQGLTVIIIYQPPPRCVYLSHLSQPSGSRSEVRLVRASQDLPS